jgi:membrane protease YdiL (CAAX protease family)
MARTLRITPLAALAVVIVVLGLLNVVDIRVARASLIVGPGVVAGLTGIARLAGLSWQDLGLGPGTWRPGLRWAAVEIAIVGLVLAAAAALPLTREAFRDTRYRLDLGNTLLTSLVLIPIGTVLVEELAFRGVLWGLLREVKGTTTVLATVLFTALSGVVFCELRRRSGSILASAGLHWATNGLAVLASSAVWAWGTR